MKKLIIWLIFLLFSMQGVSQMYIGDIVPSIHKDKDYYQLWIVNNVIVEDNVPRYRNNETGFSITVKYPVHSLFQTIDQKKLINNYKEVSEEISLMNKVVLGYLQGKRILVYGTRDGYLSSIEFEK